MDGHYRFQFNGVKLDPYRILEVYGIHHPAHQHAIKKLLRAGKSIKDLEQDIDEVILTLNRWKEMLNEERETLKSKQKNTLDTGPLAAAYHRGWTQKNKKRGEFYLTILNDLAENIEIKGRLTLPNLCEVLGWMAQEQHLMTAAREKQRGGRPGRSGTDDNRIPHARLRLRDHFRRFAVGLDHVRSSLEDYGGGVRAA